MYKKVSPLIDAVEDLLLMWGVWRPLRDALGEFEALARTPVVGPRERSTVMTLYCTKTSETQPKIHL